MIAVITGDIIDSRKVNSESWMPKLKEYLSQEIVDEKKWDIYRGDSFQIEVEIKDALKVVLCIKALMKSVNLIDVRMSIGIGDKNFQGNKITESYGTAFINSGESFELLKNNTLIIKTPFEEFDEYFKSIFKLLSFISDDWKPATAEAIFYSLNNPDLLQKEVAEKLEKDKTTINKSLKRGGYNELLDVLDLYNKKITACTL